MKIIEKPTLPREVFAAEAKPQLLAQAVRVYLANQRQGTQNAKTRAEVNRTRHKLYKQKGTGGARHGDRKAPIFVGGGIAFAPKPRDYSLFLPKQLKRRALHAALALVSKNKNLSVVSGMAKLTGKTTELAKFLAGLEGNTRNLLLVTDTMRDNVYRAARNIPGVTVLPANQLNTYAVLRAGRILLMEEAVSLINSIKTIKSISGLGELTPLKTVTTPAKVQNKTGKVKVEKTKKMVRAVKKAKK